MSFSTWRQDFGEHKQPAFRLAVLVAGVAGVPIVMLAALEVAYLLSYPACWHGYRWALYAAVLTALVPVAIVGWLLGRHHPRLATAAVMLAICNGVTPNSPCPIPSETTVSDFQL